WPSWTSILEGIWTTNQTSATLFVGVSVMWAAGIIFFDFLRTMKPSALYYALAAQGILFAAMTIGHIWLRTRPLGDYYQFLFGDIHSFASYLVLQVGLLAGFWRTRLKFFSTCLLCILFIVYSLLIVASFSRTGLTAYFAIIIAFLAILLPKVLHIRFRTRHC